ncbi:hypothetical protein G7046_g2174 [Stylonectria norvegica]|nr:hypothetical protein G7046_g2174 [Stylonectria norvegica]
MVDQQYGEEWTKKYQKMCDELKTEMRANKTSTWSRPGLDDLTRCPSPGFPYLDRPRNLYRAYTNAKVCVGEKLEVAVWSSRFSKVSETMHFVCLGPIDSKSQKLEAEKQAQGVTGKNGRREICETDASELVTDGESESAAKIVLTDDKFNSIVAAIREGRRMFDNIQKFVLHLLTSNVGEVILLVAGLGFVDKDGFSVFPVSPLQIIWINMATSSFPAFGLGREAASQDVMRKPPQDKKRGVFTNQIIVDMIVYGCIMGACTMATFCIIIYGANGGNLGTECNQSYSESCRPVFKARAATFAELTWLILISAWEFKSLRRSIFRLNPDDNSRFPVFKDIYSNKFLFWSVVIGGLSVFPVVYIPYLNTKFFKHTGITWEWALSVGFTVIFVLGIELWKMTKRHFHLLEDAPVKRGHWGQGGSDEEGRKFGRTMSFTSFKTWASFSRKDTGESLGKHSTSRGGPFQVPQGTAATEV